MRHNEKVPSIAAQAMKAAVGWRMAAATAMHRIITALENSDVMRLNRLARNSAATVGGAIGEVVSQAIGAQRKGAQILTICSAELYGTPAFYGRAA